MKTDGSYGVDLAQVADFVAREGEFISGGMYVRASSDRHVRLQQSTLVVLAIMLIAGVTAGLLSWLFYAFVHGSATARAILILFPLPLPPFFLTLFLAAVDLAAIAAFFVAPLILGQGYVFEPGAMRARGLAGAIAKPRAVRIVFKAPAKEGAAGKCAMEVVGDSESPVTLEADSDLSLDDGRIVRLACHVARVLGCPLFVDGKPVAPGPSFSPILNRLRTAKSKSREPS